MTSVLSSAEHCIGQAGQHPAQLGVSYEFHSVVNVGHRGQR